MRASASIERMLFEERLILWSYETAIKFKKVRLGVIACHTEGGVYHVCHLMGSTSLSNKFESNLFSQYSFCTHARSEG